jgi:hypothetical protein
MNIECFVGNPEWKILFERSTSKWEDRGLSVDLKQIWYEVFEWIQPTQFRVLWRAVVNTIINLQVQVKAT